MALRFNPAPGWPPAPHGWLPSAGWRPDPSWPPAPAGWAFVVDDSVLVDELGDQAVGDVAGSAPDAWATEDEPAENLAVSGPETVTEPPTDAAYPDTATPEAQAETPEGTVTPDADPAPVDAGPTGEGTSLEPEDVPTAAEAAVPAVALDEDPAAADTDTDTSGTQAETPEGTATEDAAEGPTTRPIPIVRRRSLPRQVRRLTRPVRGLPATVGGLPRKVRGLPSTVGGWTNDHKALAASVGALVIGLSGVALLVALFSPTEPLPSDSPLTGTLTQVGLEEPTPSAVPTDSDPELDPWAEPTETTATSTTTTTNSEHASEAGSGSGDRGSRGGSSSGSSGSIGNGLQNLGSSSRQIYTWDMITVDPNGNEVYTEIPMDETAPITDFQESEIIVGPEGSSSSWSESYEWSYSSGS